MEKETAARLKLKLDYDFNGESYLTVSGQNSNNSVRVPSEFFDAMDAGAKWVAPYRTNPEIADFNVYSVMLMLGRRWP